MTDIKDVLLENEALNERNEFLQRQVNALRLNNRALTEERNNLIDELASIKRMSMFEFSNKYGTPEQQEADGRAFAKALLGGI